MYAALVHLTIEPSLASKAAQAFSEILMPKIRTTPGFLEGHWVDPEDGNGFGFLLFESREAAEAGTPPNDDWTAPGVQFTSTKIRRVAASIP